MSKNAAAIILLALSVFGLESSEQDVMELVSAIGTLISFLLMIWNQANRPDVQGFFWKK